MLARGPARRHCREPLGPALMLADAARTGAGDATGPTLALRVLVASSLIVIAAAGCGGKTTTSSNGGARSTTAAQVPAYRVGQYCIESREGRYRAYGLICVRHHLRKR